MSYWKDQLDKLGPQFPVPTDRMRPLRPSLRGATYHFSLNRELTEAVKTFGHERGYTAFMIFVAVLDLLYHSYSGLDDIVIGTMIGDREIGTEGMVGSLVNLLALRTRLKKEQRFVDVLEAVRKTATDAFAHQIPFELMVKRMNRNIFRQPLFRTVFILRSVPSTETHAGDLNVKLATVLQDRGVADADLTLYLQEKQGVFSGYFEYSTDLYRRSTIEELSSRFIILLRDVLAQPESSLEGMLTRPARKPIEGGPVKRVLSMFRMAEA